MDSELEDIGDPVPEQLSCRIVYCGAPSSGKAANLRLLHAMLPEDWREELVTVQNEGATSLSLVARVPAEVQPDEPEAWLRIDLFTLPAGTTYELTRQLILTGVDAVVFVVDSRIDHIAESLESFAHLKDSLEVLGWGPDDLPMLFQYNKRDLPDIASVEELEATFNTAGWPSIEAVACEGQGVVETLQLAVQLLSMATMEDDEEDDDSPS